MKYLLKKFVVLSALLCILCTVQGAEEETTLNALAASSSLPSTASEPSRSTTTSTNITIDASSTTQAATTEVVVNYTTSTATATSTTTTTTTTSTPSTTTSTTVELPVVIPKDAQKGDKKYYISDDIPTCQQKDLNLNDCIKRAFEIMLPRLKNGNQELNVPSLDPFTLNRTTFQFSNGPVNGRFTIRKAQFFGLGRTKINAVDFKVINNNSTKYYMTSFIPQVTFVGSYTADVAFNTIRLKPRGIFNVTLTNINTVQTAEGSFYEKDGHRFVRLSKHDIQPKIDGLKIQASGLLPDPTLNEIVVNFANQYWREIYRIVLTETRQYWGPRLLSIINESLASVPYDLLIKIN